MSLQSLGLAAIARNQIQMARLLTVSSYAACASFQKSTQLISEVHFLKYVIFKWEEFWNEGHAA